MEMHICCMHANSGWCLGQLISQARGYGSLNEIEGASLYNYWHDHNSQKYHSKFIIIR